MFLKDKLVIISYLICNTIRILHYCLTFPTHRESRNTKCQNTSTSSIKFHTLKESLFVSLGRNSVFMGEPHSNGMVGTVKIYDSYCWKECNVYNRLCSRVMQYICTRQRGILRFLYIFAKTRQKQLPFKLSKQTNRQC